MGKAAPNPLLTLSALLARCAKQATRLSKKFASSGSEPASSKLPPKSPLVSPRQLRVTLSNKGKKKEKHGDEADETSSLAWGDDEGLWQKEILMGEKCQPLDFSGVIYYDREGNRVPEYSPRTPRGGASPLHPSLLPRSPRGSSPLHQSFTFPVVAADKGEAY
ncbi:hypothetical protein ACLOJK_001486 [Asimina triloba]